jgi:hypothetical protein
MQALSATFAPVCVARVAPRAAASRPAAPRCTLRSVQLRSAAPLRVAPRIVARRAPPAACVAAAAPLSNADPSKWITGITPNSAFVRLGAVAVALAAASNGDKFMTLRVRPRTRAFAAFGLVARCMWRLSRLRR